jgi:ribosomal protein S18 acetylase RimI-like enzyme
MSLSFTIKPNLPTAREFQALRSTVGWGDVSLEQAYSALFGSLFGVTAFDGDTAIGMARVIGDGVINAYIQDVVIAPDYRGKGVGKAVMQALIVQMKQDLPANCTIGLMAAEGQEDFYTSFSFIPRPNADYGAGMFAKLADITDGTLS